MIGSLECTQDIRKVVEGWYIEIDFYLNGSLNNDLESEFKKTSWRYWLSVHIAFWTNSHP